MEAERRKYPRISYPLDGTWRGASGGSACRISDISLGGCFIFTRALPAQAESTEISMVVGDEQLHFTGNVVHLDPGMGFSVAFRELTPEQRNQLQQILEALTATE